ncbi:hypothetical protein BDA99DRAFT_491508 [Phascolomyces articulosus]|uniref:Nucleoplasmin-like domain-containing protein n=1 Tax=Phascolomyces articulosus TaxID=60185 RepID=A0AAD5KQI5_9FUNG|nr:hypothetical protein BDA99DRAFT_491508 [Phascolomyces articulosus]
MSSSNFIGLIIQPNEPLTLSIDEGIHFTLASLLDNAKPGRSTLKVRVRDAEYALCSLTHNKTEQQSLDVYFKDVDEPTLLLTGVNPINITGNIIQEDDEYIPDGEDEEDEEDGYGPIQFRDPSDQNFLGGFELRHFGLEPQYSFYPDKIDLRKEEEDEEDVRLHDNIAMGLINSMMNSGDDTKAKKAKAILGKLSGSIWEANHVVWM